jgi:hypothetical protein
VAEYDGQEIATEAAADAREEVYTATLPRLIRRPVDHFYLDGYRRRIDGSAYTEDTIDRNLGSMLNHSKRQPTCKCELVRCPRGTGRRLVIVTTKPVAEGQELTYDYIPDVNSSSTLPAWLFTT